MASFDHLTYEAEAAQRWPAVYAVTQSRTAGYSSDDWRRAGAEGEELARKLAEMMANGAAADSIAAMDVAEAHRLSIDRWYPCSLTQHVGLAELYLADARFEKYWEDRAAGLARWVHDAIKANAARANGTSAADPGER